jgi:Phytanoyl-CoA dioxygenase (PhyH)
VQQPKGSEGSPCRQVTPAEIRHYQEHGWVQLKRFLNPETIDVLLTTARQRMGDDGDSSEGISQPYFTVGYSGGLTNPQIRPLLEMVGSNARELMDRQTGVGVRYFSDFFAPKLPAAKKTRNAGNGATSFHQDFITFAVDRSGGMTFWMPLEAYGAQAGTMSFVSGSHRCGVLGNYRNYDLGDALDTFPELRRLPMSDPIDYELGDITVHSHLTVHGTGLNQMDKPRWAYLVLIQPADAVWNGAPPEAFDTTGMQPYGRFSDEKFPILG